MDEPLWPARGVAEHAYCPRLFYYMTVEGVFVPSADTEQGTGVHRRVDRPGDGPQSEAGDQASARKRTRKLEEPENDPPRPRSVHSLALTSQRLALTATLDLTETEGMTAVPVEYRKGKPKRSGQVADAVDEMLEQPRLLPAPEPWPTDRVQLGLQVLLLEEAGYTVPEAVIYYAAERQRLRIEVDDALRQDALRELEAARRTARGARPLPLLNDPRCPRCSLQPLCLPDEINHQRLTAEQAAGLAGTTSSEHGHARAQAAEDEFTPRKLWPPRDDGIHVVLQREGIRVGVRGQSLRITDKDGELVRELPLASLESLAVLGSVQVSTQALGVFADKEVPLAFLSSAGRLLAMMDPLGPTSAAVRAAQVRTLDRPDKALELARAVTVAKIANQRTLLMRNHAALPERIAADLQKCMAAAERAATLDELRGHEGNSAAIYFKNFAGMFKEGVKEIAARFDAKGRQRRPPPDPINAVLSFGYSMLTNECVAACRLASLEPTLGALHTTRPGRPALALDLVEPFRPLIVDSLAISAFNRGELTEGHFLETAAGCALTDAGRKAFFSAYGRRMDTEVTHPVFEYRLSYRRMLMLHARLIAAWLLEEVPTLAFLTTR
ncbi:MAG: CRISPR-associated endonuclease Cas1 [Phycisphaerae bacterium]|jgi:CRISPR-associated protein Cas1|nr:CRISPR-associated endonuclease Cas1 [Phycisphaerae bacterium]HPC23693.1 CRISPR-associated endonuclease Cas1 [Phycisphaerae bacterium]